MTNDIYEHVVSRITGFLGNPSELPSGNGTRFKDQSRMVLTVYHSNLSQGNLTEIAVKPESFSSLGYTESQAQNHIGAICDFTPYVVNPDPKYNWPRVGVRTMNEAERVLTYLAGLNA